MKNRFRLTPVLSHRKHLEEKAQHDFVEAGQAVDEALGKLRLMESRRAQYETDLRYKQEQTGNVAGIVLGLQYLRRLKHEIDLQKGILSKLESTREIKRELLLEAVKNRKAIEKLKEKQNTDRRRKANRNENNLMDDISATRFAANHRFRRDKASRTTESGPAFPGKNFPERKSLPQKPSDTGRRPLDN